jgi:hypothetical protein
MPADFTDPAELMRLMMAETKPLESSDWSNLVALYAANLSEIAPKLNESEMWRLIAIGAAMYQRGYREFEAGMVGGHLLDLVRQAARGKADD